MKTENFLAVLAFVMIVLLIGAFATAYLIPFIELLGIWKLIGITISVTAVWEIIRFLIKGIFEIANNEINK